MASTKVAPLVPLDTTDLSTKRESQLSVKAAEALLHRGEKYLPTAGIDQSAKDVGNKQHQMDEDQHESGRQIMNEAGESLQYEKNSIMISYCRRNSEFVKRLHERMHESGRDCWVDWEDIPKGEDWWEAIKRGIERANACVICLSEDFLRSSVCKDEVDYMLSCSKRIVPIVVSPELNWDLVRPDIAKLNFVFFNRPQDDFEVSFKDLVTALDTDYGYLELHTWFTTWALDWAKHNRDPGALLKGPYLKVADEFMQKAEVISDPRPSDLVFEFLSMSQVKAGEDEMKELMLNQMLEVKHEGLLNEELAGFKRRVQVILGNPRFQYSIIGLIVIDVICGIVGLVFSQSASESQVAVIVRSWLQPLSLVLLTVFLLEILAQAFVSGVREFLHHSGFLLDLIVILLSLILEIAVPASGGQSILTVLRAWRVMRIFNISKMKLRHKLTKVEKEKRLLESENNGFRNIIQSLREQIISKDAMINSQRALLKQLSPDLDVQDD